MFAKREDWQGLERSELMKYFNDCGHFPTQSQIDEYWDLFHRRECGRSRSSPVLFPFLSPPSSFFPLSLYLSFSRVYSLHIAFYIRRTVSSTHKLYVESIPPCPLPSIGTIKSFPSNVFVSGLNP